MVDIDKIAHTVHEALRAWSTSNGQEPFPSWLDAPEWMKQATRESVVFALENPTASSKAQHERWLNHKIRDGWRYGDIKDAESKTHPMMVPYDLLPEFEKCKDGIVQALVKALTRKY